MVDSVDYPTKKTENYGTPRGGIRGKTHSEPNSTQSTPARSVTKVSCGALGGCTGTRPPRDIAMRGGSSSRVPRGISIAPSEPSMEVPHFELVEDPSFWMDHNVQVLIRIRPISTTERALQGYARSLRQESAHTLTWVGHPETRFTFDHIACETTSQEKLFKVAGLPMVENCMSGYNSCMFAYGQTGSGKTYTMMGEIHEMDAKLNGDCGMTPRIFEYLFTRIRAEEENRRDEKLKYSCKCSFLEIYNEQITDLLEPSSTNLQLREDMRKGVYVENLTEYKVTTVKDVVELLLKGAMNRKIAATHMNSESSRSHSVFTCIIESRWEIDSMTHLRFGRLNLVDLAGSERQKSSGAEGERLKEAANINKSLSTLGLVIMTLVDVAHGKHRHVPYRDSRLTFLLQDSLGGNSKTTIIANTSPSICSANETLSTLKFSQRAKLIQNNAKVNEDASGDVIALQRQIQQLKDQLTFLLKHQNVSRSLSVCLPNVEQSQSGDFHETYDASLEGRISHHQNDTSVPQKKMKGVQATLVGALRREKMAETAVRRLEAGIEHTNHLVHQWEEDVQRTKMILRFREEKIKRLELLTDGLVSADKYLMEENNSLSEEIHLLQERIDRNPEVTRFALENIRLLEQLRMFRDFYEEGERHTLLTEVSELRDQLMEILEGNYGQLNFSSRAGNQTEDTVKELEDCRRNLGSCLEINAKLTREVEELRRELNKDWDCSRAAFDSVANSLSRNAERNKQMDKQLPVEMLSTRTDSEDEHASYNQVEDEVLQIKHGRKMGDALALQPIDAHKELMEARSLIEAMEYEQVRLIEELDILQEKNCQYVELLRIKDCGEVQSMLKLENNCDPPERYPKTEDLGPQGAGLIMEGKGDIRRSVLQNKLDRMNRDLAEARLLNRRYQDDQASELFHQNEVEQVLQQVEVETANTILHLQEELTTLECEFQERLSFMTQENVRLRNTITSREDEIRELAEWEKAILELTSFLVDGCNSLEDASDQIESIANSFPEGKVWIREHVERAAKIFVEKEKTILQLQKCLENAHDVGLEMNLKLNSLKGATLAITEVQQLENDENAREVIQLRTLLSERISNVQELERRLKDKEDQIIEAEKRATAAFIVVKRLSDFPSIQRKVSEEKIPELAISVEQDKCRIAEMMLNAQALEAIEFQVELARQRILESENAINADTERHLAALLSDIIESASVLLQLVQDLTKDICSMKKKFMESKEKNREVQPHEVVPSLEACKSQKLENQLSMVQQIRDEVAEMNEKLNVIKTGIDTLLDVYGFSVMVGDLQKADTSSSDHFTSCFDLSAAAIVPKDLDESLSSTLGSGCPGKMPEQKWNLIPERNSSFSFGDQEFGMSKKPTENLICSNATLLCLRKETELAFNSFVEVQVRLAKFFDDKEMEDCSCSQGRCFQESLAFGDHDQFGVHHKGPHKLAVLQMDKRLQSIEQKMEEAEAGCSNTREKLHLKLSDARLVADEKIKMASSFLTKFEEAHATIKEADIMLNALLKANENAKHVTDRWKQAGEELMMERDDLIEEIQQLKSSICLKEGEYESLQDQIRSGLVEVADSLSSLEGSFLQMQRDVEERFKLIYSDVFSLRQDLLDCICNSRSSLEDIWSDIMEKGFALFVLYQCHAGSFIEEISRLNSDPGFLRYGQKECYSIVDNVGKVCTSAREGSCVFKSENGIENEDQSELQYKLSDPGDILDLKHSSGVFEELEEEEMSLTHENLITENLSLKRALARKNDLLRGLLFDFSLLQESTSNAKDIKDETEQTFAALTKVRHELVVKTAQVDDVLVQHRKIEARLTDSEAALSISNSELERAKETLDTLSKQNTELRVLFEDISVKKTDAEEQLEEKREVVKGLEEEILRMACSAEEKILSSIEDIEDELRMAAGERDHLREVVASLNDKLEMANALADENEAIAVEARQESEASKAYAEQKEEEVKILEHSVEELERTINVMEMKVFEMGEEVERHRLIRDDLELELHAVRHRRLNVENATENMDSEYPNVEQLKEDQTSRLMDDRILELQELRKHIRILEKERADQAKEIKQSKEYISELVLHAEAQASQYHQKYKTLEAMVREVKIDPSISTCAPSTLDKTEKNFSRTRGSSSPFKCIASLVQQMKLEKDHELSVARLQIEELEALASSRQKEVCVLKARLATAESMTHDVIRDLLGVKLDMTNYANLIDHHQVQKLVEEAQQQTEESIAKEQEILMLRKQIGELIEERQRCIEEINQREADILAANVTVEQLRQRNHMLTAQNEMLKMDKANLKRKIAEMDEMVKRHFGPQNIQQNQQPTKMKENNFLRNINGELSKRLAHSEKLLSHVNDELALYRKSDSRGPYNRSDEEQRLGIIEQEPEHSSISLTEVHLS